MNAQCRTSGSHAELPFDVMDAKGQMVHPITCQVYVNVHALFQTLSKDNFQKFCETNYLRSSASSVTGGIGGLGESGGLGLGSIILHPIPLGHHESPGDT